MKTMANVLDKMRADGWSQDDHNALIYAVLTPGLAESVTKSLQSSITFLRRMKMLRSIQPTKDSI